LVFARQACDRTPRNLTLHPSRVTEKCKASV